MNQEKTILCREDFFLWRVEFFKIGKRDFMFIREMRVPTYLQIAQMTKAVTLVII